MRVYLSSLVLVALTGCIGAMEYSSLDQVTIAAREYNQDVRWGRFDKAARHVPVDTRQRFIDKHANLEEELEIADFEMSGIEVDKGKHTATARIEYTWSLKTRGIVEKTTTKQKWERRDSEWVLAREERVKGAPLVFFDEPAREASARPDPLADK
ncbi:MAG TPA: hypothetical protein VF945_10260 [Polyangia bacterium]